MFTSAVYHPGSVTASAAPAGLWPLDPETLTRRTQDQIDWQALHRPILDVLGASAWREPSQTFAHRWTGEDTFNSGEQDTWIQIKWMESLIGSIPGDVDSCLGKYSALQNVVRAARMPRLEGLYALRRESKVRRFLLIHSHLIDVLFEAHPFLQKYFGPNPRVELEVISYPDEAAYDELVGWIQSTDDVSEGLDKLERFEEDWFLDRLDQIGNRFNFNIEFK